MITHINMPVEHAPSCHGNGTQGRLQIAVTQKKPAGLKPLLHGQHTIPIL